MSRVISPTKRLIGYIRATKNFSFNFLLAFPIFAMYTLGIFKVNENLWTFANGADYFFAEIIHQISLNNHIMVSLNIFTIFVVCCYFVLRDYKQNKDKIKLQFFLKAIYQSTKYSLLLLAPAFTLFHFPFSAHTGTTSFQFEKLIYILTLSAGAGFYEELLFRVVIAGGLLKISLIYFPKQISYTFVGVYSSILFSAWHFPPSGTKVFGLMSFFALTFLGFVFYRIYQREGFGVAVWTHALYDTFYYILLW